ncbi:hypothetical protein ACFCV3_12620 [Kribbella sp. NPDC056345]|uniref:hypothetical protein n=1 Tax=Kribbella sp. NPDC056345 TaxID=3345789 RepID=UPI0035E1BCE7
MGFPCRGVVVGDPGVLGGPGVVDGPAVVVVGVALADGVTTGPLDTGAVGR